VELLVVIAIIAILSALTAGAVFKVIGVQRSNNTQLTIKSASSLLEKQIAFVVNQAKNEVIPASVVGMAGNDPVRARVIWTKLRIKQEFPMTISEALYPYVVTGTSAGNLLGPLDLPGKKYYYDRITQAFPYLAYSNWPNMPPVYPPASTPAQSPPFITRTYDGTVPLWSVESAFCLTMALQVNRGSIVFNEESFAANALSTDIFFPQSPGGRQLLYSGPKTLVDGWGFPIFFYRWPVGNLEFYPSNLPTTALPFTVPSTAPGSSPVSAAARNASYPDPLDPQGTLMDPRWNNLNNWSTKQGVWWFEQYCHFVHVPSQWLPVKLANQYFALTPYTEPTIVSGGPDSFLGIQSYNTSPFLPEDMRFDPIPPPPTSQAQNYTFDNIVSYKLRVGGTGDK
jgi:type II secretory pathway pseudopilin PulG